MRRFSEGSYFVKITSEDSKQAVIKIVKLK